MTRKPQKPRKKRVSHRELYEHGVKVECWNCGKRTPEHLPYCTNCKMKNDDYVEKPKYIF